MLKFFNKKGVMLEFLVGVILALLIFTPTCMFTAKIFRLSQQGQDNFDTFLHELDELSALTAEKKGDTSQISVLTLDEGTALVYFEPEKENTVVTIASAVSVEKPAEISFLKPPECSSNAHCLCLFREYAVEHSLGSLVVKAQVTPKEFTCKILDYRLQLSDCNYESSARERGLYACPSGFVIERTLVKEISLRGDRWVNFQPSVAVLPRRISLHLLKKPSENSITLAFDVPSSPAGEEK